MPETLESLGDKLDTLGARLDALASSIDKRFEQVDKRFEQVDKRFEQVDRRFEQVDRRFEQVDRRFTDLEETIRTGDAETRAQLGVKIEAVETQVKLVFEKVGAIDQRLEADSTNSAKFEKTLENHDLRILALETRPSGRKAR